MGKFTTRIGIDKIACTFIPNLTPICYCEKTAFTLYNPCVADRMQKRRT